MTSEEQYQLNNLAWPSKLTFHFLLVLEEQDGRFAGVVRIAEETFEAAISSAFGHIGKNPDTSGAMLYKISEERYMDIKGYREFKKGRSEIEVAKRKLYELLKEKYG